MSIKTNELQQITAPQGSDSLLLDTAAAGTGRLTLAQAAQFFDQKLLQPGTQISAALSQKAALSAQETVEKTTVPTRTVNLAASELPAYIASLPRLLTEDLTLKVTGELDTAVEVRNFCGSGSLTIVAGSGGFVMHNKLLIRDCSVFVLIHSIEFQDSGAVVGENGLITADRSSYIYVYKCGFTGLGAESLASAVKAMDGTGVRLSTVRISGLKNAVLVGRTAVLSIEADNTELISSFQDNAFGAYVSSGGVVLLSSGIPDLLGGSAHKKLGGLIAKADGTLL